MWRVVVCSVVSVRVHETREWLGRRIFLVLLRATSGSDWGDKPCGGHFLCDLCKQTCTCAHLNIHVHHVQKSVCVPIDETSIDV